MFSAQSREFGFGFEAVRIMFEVVFLAMSTED
jgi:hypothetical protein